MGGLLYTKGGMPIQVNGATGVATTVKHVWNDQGAAGGVANWLWFRNTGAGDLTLAWTEADADASIGITLAAGEVWEGPAEIGAFYTRAAANQAFEAVVLLRRG